ncbi:MAG: homocysteine S-methyltransferase family protein [Candidatus Neomarinimicrobiota bacterium]
MSPPLILDGAMGTELQNRGVKVPLPLWSANANIDHRQIVMDIHKDYIDAGSNFITTNTFRSTAWTYRKAGYGKIKSVELAKLSLYNAVECAQKTATNSVKIVGSITSVEDCYTPSLFPGKSIAEDTYGYSIEWLLDAGVDIILFETMGNIQEIRCGLEMIKDFAIPVWLSIIMKDDFHLLDGTSLQDVCELITNYKLHCVLTNCNYVDKIIKSADSIIKLWDGQWGAYPNLGYNDYENEYFSIIDLYNFKRSITTLIEYQPNVIGLCCGSTPKHIIELKKLLNNIE